MPRGGFGKLIALPLQHGPRQQGNSVFLEEIGQIGAGKRAANGRLDVAMIQSLLRKGQVQDVVASYGQIIVDECHHVPAVSFERVLAEAKAHYLVGLTATPQCRDGHHPIIEMQLGPARFAVSPMSQAAERAFVHTLIVRDTGFKAANAGSRTIQELYAALAADEERLVLAAGRYIGEGFDDARLDTLFLSLPVSWKGTLIQYTGRLHRLHPAKKEVQIFDYVDRNVPMLVRMFEKRRRGYRAIGYTCGATPLRYGEGGDEVVLEYDEDVLRELEGRDEFV